MDIIFIRHGQSVGNIKGVLCGCVDYPLTKNGKAQGKIVCDYIFNNYKVCAIYSSKLKRAKQTIKHLSKLTKIKNIPLKEFNEMFCGLWENKTVEFLDREYKDLYSLWRDDIGMTNPVGGETWDIVLERAFNGIKIIAKDCKEKDGVAVVATHGGIIRALETHLKGLDKSMMKTIPWVSNCSITTIRVDGDDIKLIRSGYDEYLGKNKTFVPKGL
ncbi:MAG: histidine phosphatase family protein [Clostridia bacterium]|nr:histidine phosphatase family protein [Clostridia bacterium]